MPSKDLYEILGVPRTASQDELRKAYLKLAHKYHPDKTGGDKAAEDKLKEVNGAYDILKNPEKRAQYDQFGSSGPNPFGGGGFQGGFQGAGFEGFDDLFDMFFGGAGGGRRRGGGGGGPVRQPGADLEMRLRITLNEAAKGAKKSIRFPRRETCNDCNGAGAAKGSQPEVCPQCHGTGQIRAAHGFFSVTRTCNQCAGAGKIIGSPCSGCRGSGQIKVNRELSVDVPAGVETGSRLRIGGEGEAGMNGGPRGDLYIFVEVEEHPIFRRDGMDLLCEVPVTFSEAALGANIRVPTLDGAAELKVPAGAGSGAVLRMRGLGLPDIRGYRQGDLLVRVVVETPAKLNKRQRELLEEFEKESDRKTYPSHHAFQEKIK